MRLSDYEGPSAYKFLRRWVTSQNIVKRPECQIFPFILRARKGRAAAFDFSRPVSAKWFLGVVRKMAVKLGLDPAWYSNHSFRAGGATDLFIIGVPYPKIKKYGRWKSDAAMVYYRDDIEVSGAVARAFGSKRAPHRVREYAGVGVLT